MSRLDVMPVPQYDKTGGRIVITSPYGPRWGGLHAGTDIGSSDGIEIGVKVYAVKNGKIAATLNDGSYSGAQGAGINVHLLCDDGTRFKYFHLNKVLCSAGQRVKAGDVIAEVGNTGTGAAHLHFEEHSGNFSNPINNTPYVQEAINAGRWAGAPVLTPDPIDPQGPNPPVVIVPEEDIMATKAELEQVVNAAVDAATNRVLAAVQAAKPAPQDDQMWMGTHSGEGRVYVVAQGVKRHVPGRLAGSLDLLERLGFDNRGVQDVALDALPTAEFDGADD